MNDNNKKDPIARGKRNLEKKSSKIPESVLLAYSQRSILSGERVSVSFAQSYL